jgi:signal transduction histidine kinase
MATGSSFWVKINSRPLLIDTILALIVATLAALSLISNWQPDQAVSFSTAMVLTLVLVLPLILRRYFPLVVLIFMAFVEIYYRFLLIPEGRYTAYAVLFAIASAAAFGQKRYRGWVIGGVIYFELSAILLLSVIYPGSGWLKDSFLAQFLQMLLNLFLFGAAWWIGEVFRSRREREKQLEERTEQLKQEREENARRAVLDERIRIARELHDVVAHHVSVMGIQAGAARKVLAKQPAKASEALSEIEASSRQAIGELHKLLGFLRPNNQEEETSPQPSLKHLDMLIDEVRRSGLDVELDIHGEQHTLPESVDLSAYRIIQEALTNILKHAGPATASVVIKFSREMIELTVSDNGKGRVKLESGKPGGRGIIGMRERVSLHGGKLETGNTPGGGFFVKAKLPFDGGKM